MKKWKKIIYNCPYLIALTITWIFLTVVGVILLWYRDLEINEWSELVKSPFFAIVMKEETQEQLNGPIIKEVTVVIDSQDTSKEKNDAGTDQKNKEKLNQDIIIYPLENWKTVTVSEKLTKLEVIEQFPILALDVKRNGKNDKDTDKISVSELDNNILAINEVGKNLGSENAGGETAMDEDVESGENGEGRDEVTDSEKDNQVGAEDEVVSGQTRFETYTPIETDSIYYSDAGKIALTTDYEYENVPESYFKDAVFLGDSRTLGIADYSGLEADFYCENGMTIYKLFDENGITYQKNGQKVNLSQIFQQKEYGKIYIMLGMNELGYGDTEKYLEQYKAVIEQIREWQPQSVIFILANLHVSKIRNDNETEFNNVNINDKNAAAASLANGTDVFYLDSNPLFTDNDGFLKGDLTFDGVHLYANNYEAWKTFLMEHGVVRKNEGRTGN